MDKEFWSRLPVLGVHLLSFLHLQVGDAFEHIRVLRFTLSENAVIQMSVLNFLGASIDVSQVVTLFRLSNERDRWMFSA